MVSASILSLLMAAVATLTSASPAINMGRRQASVPSPSTPPFNFTYAFTASLELGSSSMSARPIPVPGGFLITEPIASGTVTGPLINATVHGGLAAPFIYNNQTVQAPAIYLYGTTADGLPFYVQEVGTGKPSGQVTRIQLSVNTTGNAGYGRLVNGYILASVNPNANATKVEVLGYLVEDTAVYGM